MYFLQKHQSGSLHYGIWSARGSPDDFRKEEEFGSVFVSARERKFDFEKRRQR